MSFTFEITRPLPIGTITIGIRNPEFGDQFTAERRQDRGETEAGVEFIQDRGVEVQRFQGVWTQLHRCERRDLEYFFGPDGANKRQRVFKLGVIVNTNKIAFGIGTDQGWSTDQGLNTGDLLVPTSASFGDVRLDQSSLQFTSLSLDRWSTSLRFRIVNQPDC